MKTMRGVACDCLVLTKDGPEARPEGACALARVHALGRRCTAGGWRACAGSGDVQEAGGAHAAESAARARAGEAPHAPCGAARRHPGRCQACRRGTLENPPLVPHTHLILRLLQTTTQH